MEVNKLALGMKNLKEKSFRLQWRVFKRKDKFWKV